MRPPHRNWKYIDLWYVKWLGLVAEVDELSKKQMCEQFDAVVMHFSPIFIKDIHREELVGHAMSLEER